MPKLVLMAQISRPFQIALLALLALAMLMATWFMVLHRSTTTSGGGSSPNAASSAGSSPSQAATHVAASGAGSGRVHHRPVGAKTHSSTTTSAASTHHATTSAASTHHATATVHTSHTTVTVHTRHSGSTAVRSHTRRHGSSSVAAPATTAALTLHNLTEALHLKAIVNLVEAIDPGLGLKSKVAHGESVIVARMKADLQPAPPARIAAELHQGKTVLLLFLNPKGYDDDATAIDTTEVAYKLRDHVATHFALANQVNSFGSITRNIQVYQTPTLLVINPKREVTTITGLTDAFALEQAIAEAKG